jgi:hypothetical protein
MNFFQKVANMLQGAADKREEKLFQQALHLAEKAARQVAEDRRAQQDQADAYAKAIAEEERVLKQEVLKSEAEVDDIGWELAILRHKYKGNIRRERKQLKPAYKKERKELRGLRKEALKTLRKAKKAYRHEYWLIFRAARSAWTAIKFGWKWLLSGGFIGAAWRKHKAKKQMVIITDNELPQAA